MTFNVLKTLFNSLILGGLLIGALLYIAANDKRPITFESHESKNSTYGSVFNKITWEQHHDADIWLMQQSHDGLTKPTHQWDKVAIKISNKEATFYQLPPGKLKWNKRAQPIDYKVRCFTCHPNGPRSIRPKWNSDKITINFWQKIKINAWNLKMKSYGRVKSIGLADSGEFKYPHHSAQKILKVKSCTLCHKESGALARGSLQLQNRDTIKFLVKNNFMPPKGFPMSTKDKKELKRFLKGF